MWLQFKSSENTVGKGEIAVFNQITRTFNNPVLEALQKHCGKGEKAGYYYFLIFQRFFSTI